MRSSSEIRVVELLEGRRLLAAAPGEFHVQFAPARITPADGYLIDAGLGFGANYGWSRARAVKAVARRHIPASPDARYDSFVQIKPNATWEIAVPNGTYSVHLVAGDSRAKRGAFGFDVENVAALRGTISKDGHWIEATTSVSVTDGRLTLAPAAGFAKNKLNFLDIVPATGAAAPPPDPGMFVSGLSDWRTASDSPIPRSEALGAAVGGKLYVFGGIDADGSDFHFPITGRSDVYDPGTDTWSRIADMPEPLTHTNAVVDGSTIWLVGGFVGDTPGPGTKHVWKYDTLADTWSRGPDLPDARGGGAAAIIGRELHFMGGENRTRSADMPTHWSLNLDDPQATWVRLADMPRGRNHMAAASIGGKIYAVGGQRGEQDDIVDVAEVDVYDPSTNTWSAAAPLPSPRSHANCGTIVLPDGRLIVIGGESAHEEYHDDIFVYDPSTNAWSQFAHLPAPRATVVAGIIGNQLIVATGNAPTHSRDVLIATLL